MTNNSPIPISPYMMYMQEVKDMETETKLIAIQIDAESFAQVKEMAQTKSIRHFLHYVYQAVNEQLRNMGRKGFVFPRVNEAVFIDGKFQPGPFQCELLLINFKDIEAAAESKQMTSAQFVLMSLQEWAKFPKGLKVD